MKNLSLNSLSFSNISSPRVPVSLNDIVHSANFEFSQKIFEFYFQTESWIFFSNKKSKHNTWALLLLPQINPFSPKKKWRVERALESGTLDLSLYSAS